MALARPTSFAPSISTAKSIMVAPRSFPSTLTARILELGPVATDISPADLVTRFYRRFIITVVDALESFTNHVITVPLLQQLLPGSDASRRRGSIRTELNRIRELLHNVDEQLES